ncbi:flagellar hook-associated protein FlgK [Sinimarinibacterium sp. CAU 1509]|uniref:flagellar hook-associated protein FlgK n=1 Tax=Sinimarinibacterium sp. CAU 1509 TaxID=2562283 RepID=UPI0010AB9B92|nr:flagellar hook-associated protein FlgK [Sinimarinibacterium sp. CAU 1509]TJY62870.1 flagellar hook-associated protein FlgK [Sinimarinibacterium sp. CAU 1509]
MADLLSIGLSSLRATTTALHTTSNNIANVNTEGYTRQGVSFVSRTPQAAGGGYIGTGVSVGSISRITDALVTKRLLSGNSAYQRLEVLSNYASRVDTLTSDPTTGVSKALTGFLDAANTLAQNPTLDAARNGLLSAAESLSSSFGMMQSELDQMASEVTSAATSTVDQINGYTAQIAKMNETIVLAQARAGGDPPNDLLDQRDQMIQQLSGLIGVSTVAQDDGSVNVFTATGQSLVLGQLSTNLGVKGDAYNSGAIEITYAGATITGQISGGQLGGLVDTLRQVIEPARNGLGEMAAGLVEAVNAQHAQGLDAYGELGGEFFSALSVTGLPNANNSGSASVTAQIGASGDLTGNDYLLRYDGSNWSMTNRSTGAAVPLSGSGTALDPFVADGLQWEVSGAPAAGDSFLLQPTRELAGQLSLAITDPGRVAAASPLVVDTGLNNSGTATVKALTVDDAGNAQLLDGVSITFTSPSTYQINGSGSFAYTSGSPISVNGWSLTLSGQPVSGDAFTVSAAGAGSSDNGNARALAAIGQGGVLEGGTQSLLKAASALVARVGQTANQTSLSLDAQASIQAQTIAEQQSVSGVNLDEEAANLLKFQQAYQASAHVIQVADELFQTLISAVRG